MAFGQALVLFEKYGRNGQSRITDRINPQEQACPRKSPVRAIRAWSCSPCCCASRNCDSRRRAPDPFGKNGPYRFIQEVEEEDERGRKTGKRFLIFPRYQQLDCVRKLVADARRNGAGQRYLIQHSAGSGKSFTIGWPTTSRP